MCFLYEAVVGGYVDCKLNDLSVVTNETSQNIPNQHIFMRDSIYAIARVCYRPSVRPSVRWVDHRKTVEVRMMKFSPYGRYGSPKPLVFAG